jgi:hypothetical protein
LKKLVRYNMKLLKNVAGLLRVLSIAAAVFYLFTTVYAAIVIFFARNPALGMFKEIDRDAFRIYFPFTDVPFLTGDNTPHFFFILLVTFAGYGLFAFLLARVFSIFKQDKLFTADAIGRLRTFYTANLVIPAAVLICELFFTRDVKDLLVIMVLHAIIGIFAWFLSVIFKQGLSLQEEQDLTL